MNDHSPEAYAVGKALFEAECQEWEADRDMIDTEWAIPAIRAPWLRRGQIALDTLALHWMNNPSSGADEIAAERADVAWWVLADNMLRYAMRRAATGEDIDLILLEIYANSTVETVEEG